MKQDKEYLTRQSTDVANRLQFAEEKMQQLNIQVDDAKRSREDMYEKYVSSRWDVFICYSYWFVGLHAHVMTFLCWLTVIMLAN